MLGKLIVFEGIDGSGKSTQFKLMCDRLIAEGLDFRSIVFPRYDMPSSALIRMYLGGDFGSSPDAVNAYAASSFYAVDRYVSYIQDWKDYYDSGGLIITDRYTTSNALHQGAKVKREERGLFFEWLYDYEFDRIGLPRPDIVLYMDIDASPAAARLSKLQEETGMKRDIHEQHLEYLANSADCGRHAAEIFGWDKISCSQNGELRSIEEIHDEIYSIIFT